jgi:hypothetical protein
MLFAALDCLSSSSDNWGTPVPVLFVVGVFVTVSHVLKFILNIDQGIKFAQKDKKFNEWLNFAFHENGASTMGFILYCSARMA